MSARRRWIGAVPALLAAIFLSAEARAAELSASLEPSNFGGEVKSATTSDGFFDQSVSVNWRNHRRDPAWPYETETADAWDFGSAAELHSGNNPTEEYFGARATLTLARKVAGIWLTELEAGVHQLTDRTAGASRAFPAGGVGSYVNVDDETQLQLHATTDLLYTDMIQPAALVNELRAHRAQAGVSRKWQPWLRTDAHAERAWLTDGNGRFQADASAMVGLSTTGSVWLWVGVGAERVGYDEERDGYWTPSSVVNVGPRLEAAWTIDREWNVAAGLSLNRVAEDALDIAPGMYASVALTYGARERTQLRAESVTQRTWREGGGWASQAFRVGLATPL